MLRIYLLTICALIAVNTAVSAQSFLPAPSRPNVIIFLADDLGYGDLGSFGHPTIQTPHLDRFAEQGVRMTDMHSGGTVCSPSRYSILTGRNGYRGGYYNIAGFFGTTLRRSEVTLAKLLKSAGYETAFFGKWHLSKLESRDEVSVNEMGFDYSFATSVNSFEGPRNPEKFLRNGVSVGRLEGWYDEVITNEASNWISNERDKTKPFFIIVSTHSPHTPIDPPTQYLKRYRKQKDNVHDIQYGGVARPDHDISQYQEQYYATVTQLDEIFGKFMKFLDEGKLTGQTLVAFTSDNGPEYPVTLQESGGQWEDASRDKCFGTPGELRGMKRFVYEGGHRVPGIVRWPGHIPAGSVSDRFFNGTDFLPTICKIAGASVPADIKIDGTNAFGALVNKDYSRDFPAMWFFMLGGGASSLPGMAEMAMRDGDYVLIGKMEGRKEFSEAYAPRKFLAVDWIKTAMPTSFELYNIYRDPRQEKDLAEAEFDTLMRLIPKMQASWLDIREEGPWWGREVVGPR